MARAYGPGSYDASYERQGRDYPLPYVRWTERRNMEEFLRLSSQGRLQIEGLISHRFPLEEAPKAYEVIMDPAQNSLAVLLKYPAAEDAAQPKAAARVEVNPVPRATVPISELRSWVRGTWLGGCTCRI